MPSLIAPQTLPRWRPPPLVPPADDDSTPPPAPTAVTKESLHDPAQQRERRDVERTAKTLVEDPAQAAFAGTLKQTPLARVLQRLYTTRASGSLLLLRDNVKKIVLLAEGYPVSVRSNLLGECLGQILLEKKLITGDALAASVARMQKEKRQQGQILSRWARSRPTTCSARWSIRPRRSCSRSSPGATGSSCSRRATAPPGRDAPRAPAGRADPGGDPAPLRRGPPDRRCSTATRGAIRRAQRRPDVAAAGDDGRSDRAGLHPRAQSTARASSSILRARQDPARRRRACCWSRCPRRG